MKAVTFLTVLVGGQITVVLKQRINAAWGKRQVSSHRAKIFRHVRKNRYGSRSGNLITPNGAISETNGRAAMPPKARKEAGNYAFLTRPHFARYRRTQMAHFPQHPQPRREGVVFRNSANFEPRIAIERGHFRRKMDWRRFRPNFGKSRKIRRF